MLRENIEDFSANLKENLKSYYKTMNEKQTNFLQEIKAIDEECQHKKKELRLSGHTVEELDNKVSELFGPRIDKIYEELNKCDTSLLYPNLKFILTLQPLVDAVNGLKIEQIESERIVLNVSNLEQHLNRSLTFDKNVDIECLVTTGMNDNGVFWIYNVDNIVNIIIDEISKYIRFQRITDRTWQTIVEANKKPVMGEKFFHLDSKTNKWMRVVIEATNKETGKLKLRYLDTSQLVEIKFKENSLLEWKEFDLNKIHYQAFKCCLFDNNSAIKYTYNEKFHFRDLVSKKNFKCTFKECIQKGDQEVWVVDLNYFEINNNFLAKEHASSINKLIIEEALNGKKFMCEDIRLLNDKNNEKIKSNFTLSSSNEENQSLKHNARRSKGKVKFDLTKNIVNWISTNVENKMQPIASVPVDLEVQEALDDILNLICASVKLPPVQGTQCYKCKQFGHKKNACSFIAPPGVRQADINADLKIKNIRAKMVCNVCHKVGHLQYKCPTNQK
jgi:hypothetical protein